MPPWKSELLSWRKRLRLQEELKRLQRELNEKSPITLFPVKIIDPREAVKILEDVCGDGTPGLLLEALPKLKCVAVRANKELTSGIAKLILELDVELPQHPRSFGPSREIPDSLKLPVSGIWGFPREPVPLPKKP